MLINVFKKMIEQGEKKEVLLKMLESYKILNDRQPLFSLLSKDEYEEILKIIEEYNYGR